MPSASAIRFCLLFAVGASQPAPPAKPKFDPGPWGAPPPMGDPESMNYSRVRTSGYVESITKDGITLYWPKREMLRLRYDPMTGALIDEKKETLPAVPAKTFPLGKELAAGEYMKPADADMTYRITHVRVGDRVSIEYDRRNGVDICKMIRIERRPGGRVPPAPGEKADTFRKHHEGANANQDWEENRTPYPRKYWSSYRGADGRLYEGPYPSDSIQIVPIKPERPEKK